MPIKRDDPKVREPHWSIEPYDGADKVIRIIGPNNFYPGKPILYLDHDDIDHDQQEAHARNIVGHMNGELCGSPIETVVEWEGCQGSEMALHYSAGEPPIREGDRLVVDDETWYLTKKESKGKVVLSEVHPEEGFEIRVTQDPKETKP